MINMMYVKMYRKSEVVADKAGKLVTGKSDIAISRTKKKYKEYVRHMTYHIYVRTYKKYYHRHISPLRCY